MKEKTCYKHTMGAKLWRSDGKPQVLSWILISEKKKEFRTTQQTSEDCEKVYLIEDSCEIASA